MDRKRQRKRRGKKEDMKRNGRGKEDESKKTGRGKDKRKGKEERKRRKEEKKRGKRRRQEGKGKRKQRGGKNEAASLIPEEERKEGKGLDYLWSWARVYFWIHSARDVANFSLCMWQKRFLPTSVVYQSFDRTTYKFNRRWWWIGYMGVSWNGDTPKSSIFVWDFQRNQPSSYF